MTTSSIAQRATGKKSLWRAFVDQRHLQAMAIPGIVWMFIFCYVPMYGIVIAFKQFDIIKPISSAPWVGFDHFIEFFEDERFWLIIRNTVCIALLKLAVCFPLPIIFALFLNEIRSKRAKKAVQTISYLPHFLSWVVVGGLLISWLSDSGVFTETLLNLGLIKEPVTFLGETKYFWPILVISELWKELGWSAIIYLAAVTSIDPTLYEAATIDGAGRLRKMWSVTLPCIKGTIVMLFILSASSILSTNFDQIFVLNNPLLYDVSDVIDIFVYRSGIQGARYSFATAVGLFKSIIALAILYGSNKLSLKLTETSLF